MDGGDRYSIQDASVCQIGTRLYVAIVQSLGRVPNEGRGGPQDAGLEISAVEDWRLVYDLVCRLTAEFPPYGGVSCERTALEVYIQGVNALLAANGIVWELREDGLLHRVVPLAMEELFECVAQELRRPEFEAARGQLDHAVQAYDARPRRDRDACANAYDAMESVAKVVFGLPNGTLGNVLSGPATRELDRWTIASLHSLEVLRNNKFGHGTVVPFDLRSAEVDYVYSSCLSGVLLFTNLRI